MMKIKKVLAILVCIALTAAILFVMLRDKRTVIGLQPFAGFHTQELDSLKNAIEGYYGFDVVILPSTTIPINAFVNIKRPRYRADTLLKYLAANKPDSIDYIVGLLDRDISTTKRDHLGEVKTPATKYLDFGIYGLGYRPGPSCVVSTFRLKRSSKENYMMRLKKITLHEIGHNLGLPHCPNPQCYMRDAKESIRTIDTAKMELCDRCKLIIGFEEVIH